MPLVERLNQEGIASELWFEENKKYEEIARGITVPQLHLATDLSPNPVRFTKTLSGYRKALRVAKPRVLHAHQMRAALLPLLAAYLEKIPYRVYHNHGLPYLGYRGGLRFALRSIERMNVALATHVVLVSHSNLTEAEADGLIPRGKGFIIGSGSAVGIDLTEYSADRFSAGAKRESRLGMGIPASGFVLGYLGRPVKRKGFHRLLAAWERSGLNGKGNLLLVAGCSEKECAEALGHKVPGVRGLGYLSDLRPMYAASDAIILPSDHEGFAYSLLEGAAAGRPLIGTDIPGIRCAIEQGVTGILAAPGDETSLLEAILTLAMRPELCAKYGATARERVERNFDRVKFLDSFWAFYQTHFELKGKAMEMQQNA